MKTNHILVEASILVVCFLSALGQPVITSQPQSQTNMLGTTATFSTTATGSSSLNYQWAFGSPPASLDGATNDTLVLTNVQVSNQGPYDVVITNLEGSVTSVVANLYVVAPPTLQFALNNYNVAESAGSVTLSVQRTSWLASTVSVDYATADVTATNGLKYTAVSGPLAFGAGETNKTIVVPILDEGFVEGARYFRVVLSNPTGGALLGARSSANVIISDNDVGIQFQFINYSVTEDAGAVLLGVVRGDDGNLPVTVSFATADLTATNGLDYIAITNRLSFAAQERLKLVPISILNNTLKQPNRSFRATLATPAGASLGSQSISTITIVDNDRGFQFENANYSVAQDAGVVRLGVLRGTDDTNSLVTVDFGTSDGSATNGLDYTGLTNTLSFAPGERSKFIGVSLLNNGLKGPSKNFRVSLGNPGGGAVLGAPTTTAVTILNSNPGVGFELASYAVWENAGAIYVTVLRGSAAALGPITVDYATSDSSAKAGQDYQAVSGTLAFQQNETIKTITIPILRNALVTHNTGFRVTLSNPTGGAALATAATAVNILDATGPRPYTLAPLFDTALTMQRDGDVNLVTWSGGGQLQRADTPVGPWQMLTTATNPYAVQSQLPVSFYRVTQPRPVTLYIPSSYDGQTAMPLLILLHAYGYSGTFQESYMQFMPLAQSRGFLYCFPDSALDPLGNEFWNATEACCDFWSTGIDDAGYLRGLIEEISRQFAVDRKRIYLFGGSNGGDMAYRMACQSADLIAGIASLAGTTALDPSRCAPSEPVNILHIHGTADQSVSYAGGARLSPASPANMPAFPSAVLDVQIWAGYNGAHNPSTDPGPTIDLDLDLAGLDTVVTRYTNAPPGGAVELWTIKGGSHGPTLSSQFSPRVIDWLLAHPKP